ncbi:hypothetical protein [Haladaptatus caseinilyticus]|nr:hypothetical protein [Haladaptatus caseinilyticus]
MAVVVGLVGSIVFDWRLDSTGNPVVMAFTVGCVIIALFMTIRRSMYRQ